ncbi:MAG: FAD:protein FMN transferase [Lachnospiraceae bacterium]|nr:FAD:protein FMN transferase [Lachnospiraceae bacterium]
MTKKIFLFFFTLILNCLLLTGCRKAPVTFSDTGFYFDTVITVTLYDNGSQEILDRCMNLAAEYENLLSTTVSGSDIWNINHSRGSYVTVSDETAKLLDSAIAYSRLSDGLVDPTIGSLSSLWNFGSDSESCLPDDTAIAKALSHVNYENISIKGNQVALTDPEASLDLGFIAKGYIGDQMKAFLEAEGVTSALINLGGNVVTVGSKPDGSPFRVGIQDPFSQSGTAALVLDLSGKSAVSAGNYERYFEIDGTRYHHILSTQNGYPADSGLTQVTIICDESARADALSTLCFILGYEKAASLLENYPEVKAVFITEDGEISYVNFES